MFFKGGLGEFCCDLFDGCGWNFDLIGYCFWIVIILEKMYLKKIECGLVFLFIRKFEFFGECWLFVCVVCIVYGVFFLVLNDWLVYIV